MFETNMAADDAMATGSGDRDSWEIHLFNRLLMLVVGFEVAAAGMVRVVARRAAGTMGTATACP